jgi:hypothetical protein
LRNVTPANSEGNLYYQLQQENKIKNFCSPSITHTISISLSQTRLCYQYTFHLLFRKHALQQHSHLYTHPLSLSLIHVLLFTHSFLRSTARTHTHTHSLSLSLSHSLSLSLSLTLILRIAHKHTSSTLQCLQISLPIFIV